MSQTLPVRGAFGSVVRNQRDVVLRSRDEGSLVRRSLCGPCMYGACDVLAEEATVTASDGAGRRLADFALVAIRLGFTAGNARAWAREFQPCEACLGECSLAVVDRRWRRREGVWGKLGVTALRQRAARGEDR